MKIIIQTRNYQHYNSPEPVQKWEPITNVKEELKIMSRVHGLINFTAQRAEYIADHARTETIYNENDEPETWFIIKVKGAEHEIDILLNLNEEEILIED